MAAVPRQRCAEGHSRGRTGGAGAGVARSPARCRRAGLGLGVLHRGRRFARPRSQVVRFRSHRISADAPHLHRPLRGEPGRIPTFPKPTPRSPPFITGRSATPMATRKPRRRAGFGKRRRRYWRRSASRRKSHRARQSRLKTGCGHDWPPSYGSVTTRI